MLHFLRRDDHNSCFHHIYRNNFRTIFDYETNSNILKPGLSGNSGLEELLQSFQDSRVQYGFVSVNSGDGKQQKVILIHWQGEAVPALKLANTASHVEEVKRFVKRVNCIGKVGFSSLKLNLVRDFGFEKEPKQRLS